MKRPNEFFKTRLEVQRASSQLGAVERRLKACGPYQRPELEAERDALRTRITELSRWLGTYQ